MTESGRDRPTGDRELVEFLRAAGFTGREWDRFVELLIKYGHHRLAWWIRSGRIFRICSNKHIWPVLPTADERPLLQEDNVQDLTDFTIEEAVLAFPKALNNNWSPDGGANLTTFFLNQCLFKFPKVYYDWLEKEYPQANCDSLTNLDGTDIELEDSTDPIEDHTEYMDAYRHLRKVERRTRKVLVLLAYGLSLQEISERLGISKKAIDGLLYRYRRQRGRGEGFK